MRNKLQMLIMMLLGVAISACSNLGDSGPAKDKMSPNDAKIIMQSLSSLGKISNSKRQSKQMQNNRLADDFADNDLIVEQLFNTFAASPTQPNDSLPNSSEESVEQKASRLGRMINNKNCDFKYPNQEGELQLKGPSSKTFSDSENQNKFTVPTFKVEISGAQCPVFITMELIGSANESIVNAQFHWQLKVINEDFMKETDITGFNLNGEVSMKNLNQNTMTMVMNFDGSGISKSQGEFTLASQVDMNMNMEISNQFKMNLNDKTSLSAGGKVLNFSHRSIMDGQNSVEEFFIEGAKVSQQEFIKTIGEFKIPGLENMDGTTSSSDTSGDAPSEHDSITIPKPLLIECQTTFYKNSEYSLDELKKYTEMGFVAPNNNTTTLTSSSVQGHADLFGIAKAVIRYSINKETAEVSALVRRDDGFISNTPVFKYNPSENPVKTSEAYSVGDFNVFMSCITR